MTTRVVRAIVVDDHPSTRVGVVAILRSDVAIEVVAETGTVADAIAAHREKKPDVMVIDVGLPDGTGIDLIEALRAERPDVRVMVLTGLEGEEHAYRALRAGALGYLWKSVAPAELIAGVHAVASGKRHVQHEVASAIAARVGQPDLSAREIEVLRLIATGRSNGEIALTLEVSASTVRTHVSRLLEKLGASDRTEAATMAIRRGIV